MKEFAPRCSRCGHGHKAVKNGKTKNGKQRYKCNNCGSRFLFRYSYNAYSPSLTSQIVALLKEGMEIRSISRFLGVSPTTVLLRIKVVASKIAKPRLYLGRTFELDEMCTFVQTKECKIWISYAIDRRTRQVVDFRVGKRTNKTLRGVIDTLLLSEPKRIFTDKLRNYRFLIPKKIHSVKWRATNHIERKNLTLRTHLKRLNRRTICFSKSIAMLTACLKIYFWG